MATGLVASEREFGAVASLVPAPLVDDGMLGALLVLLGQAGDTIAHLERRIERLEALAMTDELTGLLNRRGFAAALAREMDRCARGLSEGGVLVMIDLDNFKAVNDTHGHLAGDAALRLVGRTLAAVIRGMDAAARPGGDEFVLLLSDTTGRKSAGRVQQLACQLNSLGLAWHGDIVPVRASLGLKSWGVGDRLEDVFGAADAVLYAEKTRRKQTQTEDGLVNA